MTPNASPPPPGHPPDGLDRLLSDYFKNELPKPWPAPRAIAEPAAPRPRRDAGSRSRYTLAASVAALIGLGVYLSAGTPAGQAPNAGKPDLLNKAEADGKGVLKHVNPMPVEHDPMRGANMP